MLTFREYRDLENIYNWDLGVPVLIRSLHSDYLRVNLSGGNTYQFGIEERHRYKLAPQWHFDVMKMRGAAVEIVPEDEDPFLIECKKVTIGIYG